MAEALVGLAGAVMGAAIAGALQRDLTRRQEQRATGAAARLLISQLERTFFFMLNHPPEDGSWRGVLLAAEPELERVWSNARGPLAAGLNDEEWSIVDTAARGLLALAEQLREARDGPTTILGQAGRLWAPRVGSAITVLERHATRSPRPGSRHRTRRLA